MNRIYFGVVFFVSILHNTSAINYQCSVCPIGKYKSATSNNECVNCPANTYQDVLGATSATHCKPCPSNSYAPAGSGRNTDCLCGLGYTGDVASYSTGLRNVNLQRSCGATLTDACTAVQNKDSTGPSNAIDTNSATQSMSLTPSVGDSNYFTGMTTWWRVRFERQAIVQNLEIYNTDALKMSSFSIRVGNIEPSAQMEQNALCVSNMAWPAGVSLLQVTCTQALQGQYLYIINGVTTNLILNNVQVMGYLLPASEVCVGCIAGKYKATNGTGTCTDCASGSSSAVTAATSASTCAKCLANSYSGTAAGVCTQCPANAKSELGSISADYCLCNAGYTAAPSTTQCTPFQTLYQGKKPWAHYSAAGWNAQTKVLTDESGNGRNTVNTGQQGGIQGLSMKEGGATNTIPFLRGSTVDRLDFPEGSIPQSFTICSLTKYAGTSQFEQGRILTALNSEWWHGHYQLQRGVAKYASRIIMSDDGLTKIADPVWNTPTDGLSVNTNWLVMCSKNGGVIPYNVLADSQSIGTSTRSDGNVSEWYGATLTDKTQNMMRDRTKQMCINCNTNQRSAWDLAQLLIWDSHLTDNEMQTVSTELQKFVTLNTQCSVIPGVGCVACAAGKYKASDGGAPCTDCMSGKYRTFEAGTMETQCLLCPANTFSFSASTLLTNCSCNAGYSGASDGVACVACVAGSYKTAVGIGTCTNCAVNEYSTTVAQVVSTCSSCPSFAQAPAGSSQATSCQCNAGYTGANGQVCLGCVQGSYKPTVGPSTCTLCGNNTYSSVVAATSSAVCTACQGNSTSLMGSTRQSDCHCLMGYLTNNLGAANASCQMCSAGSYNSQLDATTCSRCGAGYKSSTPGAVSAEQCTACGVNTFSAAGAAQCEICPINTFAPGLSDELGDCKCLAGHYSQVTGQDGLPCSACQAGKHKAQTGPVTCTDCLANQYSTATAATSNATCIQCTANAVSPVGSSNSTMCLCTTGFTGSNAVGCSGCSVGKFKPTTGPDACTDCPANTYSGLTAQKSNATCTLCYENSISPAGSDTIDDCSCSAGFEFS